MLEFMTGVERVKEGGREERGSKRGGKRERQRGGKRERQRGGKREAGVAAENDDVMDL